MQNEKPPVSEQLQKLCSWAVITLLDMHPRKGGMPPTLVYKRADEGSYRFEVDSGAHGSLDTVLENARLFLENNGEIEAYAILVDSTEDIFGLPESRPSDDGGNPYPSGQTTLFVYLGERETGEGILVIQCYSKRPIRGGAAPLGAPLIMHGPDSLLHSK
ncbi:MAG: hypothetical protein HGA54_01130 [Actinobacteria bacterium]|nr:hypothetical protein [Actinomycetota bacterium]